MQRTGRSGHAQFRVIVQDSRFSPKRGQVVNYLGSYNPHTKTARLDADKAAEYLKNGAQPSDRVARLFKQEGIKLPAWVKLEEPRKRTVRNPEKRRSTAPARPETPAETSTEPPAAEAPAAEPAEPEAEKDEPAKTPEQTEEPKAAEPDNEAPAVEETSGEPAAEKPAENSSEG